MPSVFEVDVKHEFGEHDIGATTRTMMDESYQET